MSNIFLYEPFYDFDRLFDEAFSARQPQTSGAGSQLQHRRELPADGAIRQFKPRYAVGSAHRLMVQPR